MSGCASQNSSARAAISSRLRVLLFISAHLLSPALGCSITGAPTQRCDNEDCSSESPVFPRRHLPLDISCQISKCGDEKQMMFFVEVDRRRSGPPDTKRERSAVSGERERRGCSLEPDRGERPSHRVKPAPYRVERAG